MKKTILPLAALAVAAMLGACKPEPKVLDDRAPDPLAEAKKKAPKVVLPPPVKASVTFRCKDNSLVAVDFFQGDQLANFRGPPESTPVQLKAEEAGKPFTNGTITLAGNATAITVDQPGKDTLSCHV